MFEKLNLPPALLRHIESEAEATLHEQRRAIGASLAESEARHARDLPRLERECAEKVRRLQKAEAEVEAARGPAVAAEAALASEKGRAAAVRDRSRANCYELAVPRLLRLHRKACAMLDGRYAKFAAPAVPTKQVQGLNGRPAVVRDPAKPIPKGEAEHAHEAVAALGEALRVPDQDAAAIERAFYAALPVQFAADLRATLGEPDPEPGPSLGAVVGRAKASCEALTR